MHTATGIAIGCAILGNLCAWTAARGTAPWHRWHPVARGVARIAARLAILLFYGLWGWTGGAGVHRLAEAACQDDIPRMRLLVSLGVNPSHAAYDSNYTPLFYAAQYGNMRAVQYLVLEAKADINGKSRSMNALMVARSYGHRRIVRFLEEQGANDSPAPYWMRP
jgi:hypothetical protein